MHCSERRGAGSRLVGDHREASRRTPAGPGNGRLGQIVGVLGDWEIVPFDVLAANRFASLRRQRIRIGTMDLKIVSIALVNDALLVSANTRDYSLMPDLRCEIWLQP